MSLAVLSPCEVTHRPVCLLSSPCWLDGFVRMCSHAGESFFSQGQEVRSEFLAFAIRGGGGGSGGGGGCFFLACEDFGRMFDNLFPACAFFFFFLSGD